MSRSHIQQVRAWLLLAGASLFIASCLAVVLVLSRIPALGDLLAGQGLFRTALVLHVDLSLYVWLLALVAMLTALIRRPRCGWWPLAACLIGVVLMLLSPLQGGVPILTNYLPVLDSPLFYLGFLLFSVGIVLQLLAPATTGCAWRAAATPLACCRWSILAGLVTTLLTFWQLPEGWGDHASLELLFWGGGHVLQQGYLLLMLTCWVMIIDRLLPGCLGEERGWLWATALLPALAGVLVALLHDPTSVEFRASYTLLMRYCSWLVVPVVVWLVIRQLRRLPSPGTAGRPEVQALLGSIALLLIGFLVGALIRGDNLQVPAHYHGVTGAINLAVMGMLYRLLPQLGHREASPRLASLQVRLYGGGLLLLVAGLAWSGWLGVSRKVAGSEQGLSSLAEWSAMGVMALGGLVALSGAFLFLGILFQTMRQSVSDSLAGPLNVGGIQRLAAADRGANG